MGLEPGPGPLAALPLTPLTLSPPRSSTRFSNLQFSLSLSLTSELYDGWAILYPPRSSYHNSMASTISTLIKSPNLQLCDGDDCGSCKRVNNNLDGKLGIRRENATSIECGHLSHRTSCMQPNHKFQKYLKYYFFSRNHFQHHSIPIILLFLINLCPNIQIGPNWFWIYVHTQAFD